MTSPCRQAAISIKISMKTMYFNGFRCVDYAETYPADRNLLLCSECENLLDAAYDCAGMKSSLGRGAVATPINFSACAQPMAKASASISE